VSQTRSAVHTAGGAVQRETEILSKATVKSGVAAAVKVVKNESVPESDSSHFKNSSNNQSVSQQSKHTNAI
jgi:hypothetical protein